MSKRITAWYASHRNEEPWVVVKIMAIADGYAMVRRKGAMPFVLSEKDLHFVNPQESEHSK